MKAQIVIGANFGDEGKGGTVDYLASQVDNTIVVRFNGGSQAGHCQTGDTLITTQFGLKYIKDVVGNITNSDVSFPLINMNGDIEHTSWLFTEHSKQVNRITLQNGVVLKGTHAHKYYVWNGNTAQLEWVKIGDLNPNVHQFIVPRYFDQYLGVIPNIQYVQSETDHVHNKRKIDVDIIDLEFLAFLTGIINGDGHYASHGSRISIQCHISQQDTIDYVVSALTLMNIPVKTQSHHSSDQCITIAFESSDLINILRDQLGVAITTGVNKCTPKFVLQGTRGIIRSYIRGLFDADGTIKFHKQKTTTYGQIGFSNISWELVSEVQQLLYLFGIHSKVITNKLNKKRSNCQRSYDLIIASYDAIELFAQNIGFQSDIKNNKVVELLAYKQNANSNCNTKGYVLKVPPNIKKAIYKQLNCVCHDSEGIRTGFVVNEKIENFENIVNVATNYHIINIESVDMNFSIEQVYDVTMPITHSYIANGCISHNTVETPEGLRHVFHHFGSGTLIGKPTYLSRFFVVDPVAFYSEHNSFNHKGIKPKVFVDVNAYLVTPFDVAINQTVERARGERKHGSCGFGINETVERNTTRAFPGFGTTVADILNPDELRKKLKQIRDDYTQSRLEQLGVACGALDEFYMFVEAIEWFIDRCMYMLENITTVTNPEFLHNYDTVVFEGAQGLLLDEFHHWFPHVTRSRTGVFNACEILKEIGVHEAEVFYITRSYLTRHGAGPLPFEVDGPIYEGIIDNTNVPNEHQGTLRYAPLNFDLLEESIINDLETVAGVRLSPKLVVTCMNQLPEKVKYVEDGEVVTGCKFDLIYNLSSFGKKFDSVLLSYSPTRNLMSRLV
jgi:adenylosuccinate synthase